MLFVLSEDRSLVPYKDRLAMVKAACAKYDNVSVVSSGSYMISSATFPSYFLKDADIVTRTHAELDATLFTRIAAALNLTRRYVGEEPFSHTTSLYNEALAEVLPKAGIELAGTEVKALRAGTVNLKDAWCSVKDGELWVRQMHISPYEKGNIFNKDPIRPRRLLMHKREIQRLASKVQLDGYAIVPLSVYLKNSRVKVEVALCKGKKLYDKRQDAANKDARRQIDRAMKERNH